MTEPRATGKPLRFASSLRFGLPAVVAFAAVVGLAFASGGFFPHTWTACAVAFLWLAALALLLSGELELGTFDGIWLVLIAAFLGWTALSISWSPSHGTSLLEVRRDLVYLAGAGSLVLLATRRSVVALVAAVWASATVVVVYALARYLLQPGSRIDPFQGAVLNRPLGYANALGVLAALGTVLAVALAAGAPSRKLQKIAAASVASFAAALYLTSSRASFLAAVAGVAVMLIVDCNRPRVLATLCLLTPAVGVVVAMSARSRLVDESTIGARAEREGYLLALSIVVAAGVLACVPWIADQAGRRIALPRRTGRVLTAATLTLAVIAAVVLVISGAAGHFFNTGFRLRYWHVAWIEYSSHPWLGSGAGTFGDYWVRYGTPTTAGGALDAHNLYLETLAEVGPLGAALLVSALALPLAIGLRVHRQPFVAAGMGAYVALLAHAALDWDWEMPAVMLAGIVCAAALIVAAREASSVRELSARTRGALLAVALGLALFALLAQIL